MKKGILALTVGAAIVAACGLHFAGNGVSASAEESVSVMGTVFEDVCPICMRDDTDVCVQELRDAETCLYYCYCFSDTSQGGHGHAGYYYIHKDVTVEEQPAEDGLCPDLLLVCQTCGAEQVQNGHDIVSVSTATCTSSGKRTDTCLKCGYQVSVDEPPLGHQYELVYERLPLGTEAGEQVYRCLNCGHAYGKVIPAASDEEDKAALSVGEIILVVETSLLILSLAAVVVLLCKGATKKKE